MELRGHASPKQYVIGFILSLLLTAEAYFLTVTQTFTTTTVILLVLGLAIVQLMVQLSFFLHINRAFKAPWNIVVLLSMFAVVCTLVFGSWWIMHNLDYRHGVTTKETTEYFKKNEDL